MLISVKIFVLMSVCFREESSDWSLYVKICLMILSEVEKL